MMRALEHCITIWESVREDSMEAYKAAVGLRVMVDKLIAHRANMQQLQLQLQQQQQSTANPSLSHQRYNHPSSAPGYGIFPGGTMADFNKSNDDDMPPEQSAAMTLGMLSTGGMSPNFAMGGTNMGGGQAMGASSGGSGGSYPASMAGLLNEPMQSERTGLTPQFSGPDAPSSAMGINGAASPFSQMFGAGGGFTGMDGLGADIDWVSLS
jgi:hypothetical protein